MKDILHPLCLAIAGAGFLLLLRDLRKGRRDHALVALALTYFFSALSYATSITAVWIRIDSTIGITNIAVPLAMSCVILVFALQATVLAYWTKTPEAAARRTKILFALGISVIAGLFGLFALLTPATQRPVDFTMYYAHDPAYQAYLLLYTGTYTVAEIYLARVCWRHARDVGDPWIRGGLRLIAIGAVITLGYSGIRLTAIFGAQFDFSVQALEPYAWLCGDIGAALTQIGYFIPIVAARFTPAYTWLREHRQYRRLEDLWQAIVDAEPSVALEKPIDAAEAFRERRSVAFELYRRAVEIRDGQMELRPYLDQATREESELRWRAWWRSNARVAAAVTADQIREAIIQKEHGTVVEPATYADAALPTPTTVEDLRHLVRVAAYFTPPTVTTEAEALSTTGARK